MHSYSLDNQAFIFQKILKTKAALKKIQIKLKIKRKPGSPKVIVQKFKGSKTTYCNNSEVYETNPISDQQIFPLHSMCQGHPQFEPCQHTYPVQTKHLGWRVPQSTQQWHHCSQSRQV